MSFSQEFEVKENSGLNKLERITSIETYMVKMDSTVKALQAELKKSEDPKKLLKLIDELTKSQEQLKKEVEGLRTTELAQLKKDIEFVDQEKVEKLIDKFVKYQEDTDKRIKLLEESLKEINGQLKRVDSPFKN
ncbi:hypothetical protein [Halobacteriovorax sp. JY17]|uniref:hypothetical protein n=1 Tax=Halobacteriovorax sp. JY17 TaxID=2014617 RepID=UPI000C4BCE79|nr:hypothetical protein [Halobacteriovorax sp. JY17]PIK15899.1 MAG: hypothetical protein CES88_04010 [Halobacteriovorax sp. JY17]